MSYGRIGTDGQSKTKETPSIDAAGAEIAKLVAEKLGKGYGEVGAAAVAPEDPVGRLVSDVRPAVTKIRERVRRDFPDGEPAALIAALNAVEAALAGLGG